MYDFNKYLLSFIILLMNLNIQSIYCESIEFMSKDGKLIYNNYSTTTRRPLKNLKSYLITSYNTARNKQQSNFDLHSEMPRARKISSHTEFLYPTYNNNGYSTIDQSRVDEEEKQNIDRFFPPPYFSNAETNRPTEVFYDITTEKSIKTIGNLIPTIPPSVLAPTFTPAIESGPPAYARFPITSMSDEDNGEESSIDHSPKHTGPVSFMPAPLDKNKTGEMDSYIDAFTSQKIKDEHLVNSYSPPHTGPVSIYPPDFDGIVYPPITQQSNKPSDDPYYPSMVVDTHSFNDSEPGYAYYGDKKQIEKHPPQPNLSASTYHELAKSKTTKPTNPHPAPLDFISYDRYPDTDAMKNPQVNFLNFNPYANQKVNNSKINSNQQNEYRPENKSNSDYLDFNPQYHHSENNNERPSSLKLTSSSSHLDLHGHSPNQNPQKSPTKLKSTRLEYIDFNPHDYHPQYDQDHHSKKPPIKSNTPLPEYLDFNPQDHHPENNPEHHLEKPTKLKPTLPEYLDFNPQDPHLENSHQYYPKNTPVNHMNHDTDSYQENHPENSQEHHPAIGHEHHLKRPPTKLISTSSDYLDFNPEEHHFQDNEHHKTPFSDYVDYNPHGSKDQELHAQYEQKKPKTSKPDISALPDDLDFVSQEQQTESQKMIPHRTTNRPRAENHGYSQYLDFAPNHDPDAKYLEYIPAHDDYHHVYHEVMTTSKPMVEDQRVNKRPYSYYYLGRKLWYIPLYFSLYFIVYIFALIVKSIFRHKVQFPNDHNWGDFKARSFNQNHHETLNTVTENVHKGFENIEYSFGPTETDFVDTIDPTT